MNCLYLILVGLIVYLVWAFNKAVKEMREGMDDE